MQEWLVRHEDGKPPRKKAAQLVNVGPPGKDHSSITVSRAHGIIMEKRRQTSDESRKYAKHVFFSFRLFRESTIVGRTAFLFTRPLCFFLGVFGKQSGVVNAR